MNFLNKFMPMKRKHKFMILAGLMIACIIPPVVSQTKPDHFVGSTPCDSYIRSVLKIGDHSPCEFTKWKLDINRSANTFTAEVLYGVSLPNTNGFQNSGTKLNINGSLELKKDGATKKSFYTLSSAQLQSRLSLRVLDNNVLHMLGTDQRLLVGNGGFSYSLNRQ